MTADELAWRTPSRCETGACVEVGTLDEIVMVRRSPDLDGRSLKFRHGEWQAFVAGLKDGKFDGL
jgi:Domain of unknown function (DUF397)